MAVYLNFKDGGYAVYSNFKYGGIFLIYNMAVF
jgi:tRNA splicing endonuclease